MVLVLAKNFLSHDEPGTDAKRRCKQVKHGNRVQEPMNLIEAGKPDADQYDHSGVEKKESHCFAGFCYRHRRYPPARLLKPGLLNNVATECGQEKAYTMTKLTTIMEADIILLSILLPIVIA